MKRYCIIVFAVLMAMVSTDAIQFFKVPQMLKHFIQHSEAAPDLSFADFLLQHYSNEPHTDDDDAEDMKLPFKKTEHTAGAISYFFIHKTYVENKPTVYGEKPVSVYSFSCTPSECGNSIWQPPKQA